MEGIEPLALPEGCISNHYKFVAMLSPGRDRAEFKHKLREQGVGASGEVYARPLHDQPIFSGIAHGPLPNCDDVCARHVCLPVHSDMSEDEAMYVVDAVRKVLLSNA